MRKLHAFRKVDSLHIVTHCPLHPTTYFLPSGGEAAVTTSLVGPILYFHKNEWDKPKRNTIVEQAFGAGGAGLEAIAASGIAIDKNGTASNLLFPRPK